MQPQLPSFQTIPAIVTPYFPLFLLHTAQQSSALPRPASVPPVAAQDFTFSMPALGVELFPQGAIEKDRLFVYSSVHM